MDANKKTLESFLSTKSHCYDREEAFLCFKDHSLQKGIYK